MKLGNIVFGLVFAFLVTFFLYQKGIIFANFETIEPTKLEQFMSDGNTTLIDVREPEELVKDGVIEGAINIPLGKLEQNLPTLQKYKKTKLVVYCRSGNRSAIASRIIAHRGYKVYNLKGGITLWKKLKSR